MPKKVKSKKPSNLKKVGRNSMTPATHGQLEAVRSELKSEFTTLSLKMDSRFKEVNSRFTEMDSRFKEVNSRFTEMDSRFEEVNSRFTKVDSKFEQIHSVLIELRSEIQNVVTAVQSVKVVVEEQNSRNLFVMDGLRSVVDVQQDLMDRVQKLEKTRYGVEN